MGKRSKILLTIATIAFVAIASNIFGNSIAREFPGYLTYFSFLQGPMQWKYEYKFGEFDDIKIGCDIRECLDQVSTKKRLYLYPDTINAPRMSSGDADFLNYLNDRISQENYTGDITFSYNSAGVPILLVMSFQDGVLDELRASGALFGGL